MDWRVLFIIILTFVMFIGMGKNPLAPKEGYVPPDTFKEGIQGKLSGQEGYGFGGAGGGFGAGGGGGRPFGGPGSAYQPPGTKNTGGDPNHPADIGGTGVNAYGGGKMPVYGYPNEPARPRIMATQEKPQPAAPNVQTVPKTVAPEPSNPFSNLPRTGRALQQQPEAEPQTTMPASPFVLDTGEPIYFEGSQVFTVDAQGQPIVLPDGAYTLKNGTKLTVKDGNQVAQQSPF